MTVPPFNDIRCSGDRASCTLILGPDHDAFSGHFPEMPVLPGVIQIDWAMQLAARCFALREPVARAFQVKFMGIIQPGADLHLTLALDRTARRLSFEYRKDERVMSSGRVMIEPPP